MEARSTPEPENIGAKFKDEIEKLNFLFKDDCGNLELYYNLTIEYMTNGGIMHLLFFDIYINEDSGLRRKSKKDDILKIIQSLKDKGFNFNGEEESYLSAEEIYNGIVKKQKTYRVTNFISYKNNKRNNPNSGKDDIATMTKRVKVNDENSPSPSPTNVVSPRVR